MAEIYRRQRVAVEEAERDFAHRQQQRRQDRRAERYANRTPHGPLIRQLPRKNGNSR